MELKFTGLCNAREDESVDASECLIEIRNVSPTAMIVDIHNLCKSIGDIIEIHLFCDDAGKNIGLSTVQFATKIEAETAVLCLNDEKFMDRNLVVTFPMKQS